MNHVKDQNDNKLKNLLKIQKNTLSGKSKKGVSNKKKRRRNNNRKQLRTKIQNERRKIRQKKRNQTDKKIKKLKKIRKIQGRRKRRGRKRKGRKLKREKTKQNSCQNISCLNNLLQIMKIDKDQVQNFIQQKKRMDSRLELGGMYPKIVMN